MPKLAGCAVVGYDTAASWVQRERAWRDREGEGEGGREREKERGERACARERERTRAREGADRLWISSYMRAGADHGLELLNAAPVAGSSSEEGNGEAGVGRKLLQGKGAASVRGMPVVVPPLWTAGNTPRQVLGMND